MLGQAAAAACCANKTDGGLKGIPSGRTVAFPMVDPFAPAIETGSPMTAAMVPARGRRYYGLNGGMGFGPDLFPEDAPVSGQGVSLPGTSGIDRIFADIGKLLPSIPAIISASKSQPYYNPQPTTVYGTPLRTALQPGQTYNADGSLSNVGANVGASLTNTFNSLAAFVATNPLIVLGGGAALFLLFRDPPRRR